MAVQIDRAIFLHIPKTGGTFVTNYFKETNMDHGVEDLAESAHINGLKLKELRPNTEDLAFCFVRHPLTWYRSYWQMKQVEVPARGGGWIDSLVDLPFHDYLTEILKQTPGYLTRFFGGYTERCRIIGKQENLREDLDNILRFLRIPYRREYIYRRVSDNVIPSTKKYSYELAMEIMRTESIVIRKYDYDYIPLDVIE